jgi:hypothetical protein
MSLRSYRQALFAAAGVLFCGVAMAAGFPKIYHPQTGRVALQASKESGKPVMVYFSQVDCIWCSRVEDLLATSPVRFTLIDSYHFVNVDIRRIDDPATNALMQLFKVRGTPAFAFLSPKGVPICMVYGNIKDDEELANINATVQGLAGGGTATASYRGFPSCRGKVTADDSLITELR